MSGLGDWIARTVGQPAGVHDMMADLLREHKTVTAASRAIGMDRRTWQRWASGKVKKPSAPRVEKMRAAHTDVALIRDADVQLNVTDKDTDRQRVIKASKLELRPGTMRAVAAEYRATGDQERAARVFLLGIGDDFYRRYLAAGVVPAQTDFAPSADTGSSGGGGYPGSDYDDGEDDSEDYPEDDFDLMDWDDLWGELAADSESWFGADGYGGEVG